MAARFVKSEETSVFALVAALLLFAPSAQAQQTGTVTGTVRAAGTDRPLVGAQVAIPDENLGATTGDDGRFLITGVPTGEVDVQVQMLGYGSVSRTVVVQPGETVVQDFTLEVSALALDGLVVTATGEDRRREVGNAISLIQASEEMERINPTTVTGLIQGRATGVQILQSSGTVGGTSTIKIRGNTSIGLDNTPIIYIDGARVSNDISSGPGVGGQNTSRLNDLNPDDIESIEVVKGPSAATLYGTEAAAGVIRVTTKRGRSGEAEWTFRSDWGANWDNTDWPDNVFNPRAFFGDAAPDTLYTMNLLQQVGTEINPWRAGFEQTYGLSVRGGFDQLTYFLSGEFGEQEGSLPNNELRRRSFRANIDLDASENVNVSVQTGITSSDAELPDNDNNGFGFIGVALIGFPWELPLVRDDPTTGEQGVETCPIDFEVARIFGVPLGSQGCAENPFFGNRTFDDVKTLDNTQDIERITTSVTLDYTPFDFLSGRVTVGYDEFSDQTGAFVPVDPDRPFDDFSDGFRSINNFVNRNFTLDGNIQTTFDLPHELSSTTNLGGQFFRESLESAGSIGRTLPSGTETVSNAVVTEGFENVVETRTGGFFVEQRIGWRDRLFVTPGVRVDDNSAFGDNLGLEEYPRVTLSWVTSEESWFPRTDLVQSLRLRGAWGESGKQPGSFAALQLLSADRATFRDDDRAGVSLTRPASPNLKPETAEEFEIGLEAELFQSRLGIDFTWFRKETDDAIVQRQLAPSTGFPNAQFTNVGEVRNRGFEVGINGLALDKRDLRWDWTLNFSTLDNEVTQLAEPIIFGFSSSQRHQEGLPFAAYYDQEVVIGSDGEPELGEEKLLGQPTPEWEGSLSTSVTLWNRITLHANLGFAGGHQLFNSTEEFMCGFLGGGRFGGTCEEIFETGPDGELTEAARKKAFAAQEGTVAPWIEDADFARLRSVSATLQLPSRLLAHVGASRGSITLSGENLAVITNYDGLDPEITAGGGAQAFRAEFLTLPPARRFTGRLSISF